MIIKTAVFDKSSTKIEQCPVTKLPEFAFIGRSNVGKSSLINMLTNIKGLAKTSASPGKTQLINHFLINDSWYLVDLPGSGYAKISRETRLKWEKMIKTYLEERENLTNTFILIDSRLDLQAIDLELINWFGEKGLPFVLLFTKSDKLTMNELAKSFKKFQTSLLEYWEELPPMIVTSSKTKKGMEDVLKFIEPLLKG